MGALKLLRVPSDCLMCVAMFTGQSIWIQVLVGQGHVLKPLNNITGTETTDFRVAFDKVRWSFLILLLQA